MTLKEYQDEAQKTDQTHGKSNILGYIVPLLGIIGELGSLVSEFKKRFRDGKSYTKFSNNLKEELGDVLWYIANIASKFDIRLEDVAFDNLEKIKNRFPASESRNVFQVFDDYFPEKEQLPREMDVEFVPLDDYNLEIRYNSAKIGDTLTDNAYVDDGYRYHDVFHLAFAAVLGWSPVLRKLLGRKRKSVELVDEVQDGARAYVIEEAISAYIYSHAKDHNFYEGINQIDDSVINTVKRLVEHLEVSVCTSLQWEKAILSAFNVFRELRKKGGGTVHVSLNNQTISVK